MSKAADTAAARKARATIRAKGRRAVLRWTVPGVLDRAAGTTSGSTVETLPVFVVAVNSEVDRVDSATPKKQAGGAHSIGEKYAHQDVILAARGLTVEIAPGMELFLGADISAPRYEIIPPVKAITSGEVRQLWKFTARGKA